MRKKQIIKVGIFGLAAIFLLSMASSSTDQDAAAQAIGVNANICMIVEGDITAPLVCHAQGIKDNTTQLIVRPFVSDLSYFQGIDFKADGDGAECFKNGIDFEDNITLAVVKERDGSAWARVYFWGCVNDGETELLYGLHMYGTFSGDWPPQDGKTTDVHLYEWEMVSEGRGKLKKVSCTGSGTFYEDHTPDYNEVLITVTRTDL